MKSAIYLFIVIEIMMLTLYMIAVNIGGRPTLSHYMTRPNVQTNVVYNIIYNVSIKSNYRTIWNNFYGKTVKIKDATKKGKYFWINPCFKFKRVLF